MQLQLLSDVILNWEACSMDSISVGVMVLRMSHSCKLHCLAKVESRASSETQPNHVEAI